MPIYYTNPVYPDYFADPFVWKAGQTYYAVGTGSSSADDRGPSHFPMLQSPDLIHWSPCGWALNKLGPEFGDAYWAPEVAYADGIYYLYYSVGHGHKSHQLRVAISDSPSGPYTDTGLPVSDPAYPFAIDAHPFRDADGQWYMFYSRDFLDWEGGAQAGTAVAVDRLVDMVRLAGDEQVVARATHDWQRFAANREMYGSVYDWHTLEGPVVLLHAGKYYCFYSGGCFQNETYGVDYVESDSVMGPYSDSSSPAGPRVLRTVPGHVIGPGHNSFVTGPDGESTYIVYHAWDPGMIARRMCIDKLRWTADGPVADGPTWTRQEM
jgi:beta-xylosidase